MTETSDRYSRLADAMAGKIARVPAERWTAPSPCADWTVRDVVRHLVNAQGMFLGFVGRELPAAPSVDEDPLAAWNSARAAIQADLEDPARAAAEFDAFAGRSTFEAAVDRFLCFDLVVHGWDIASAAGLDDRIDPRDVARVREQAEAFGPALRSPQAFGPEVEPPPGAGDQERLLAFLGRRP